MQAAARSSALKQANGTQVTLPKYVQIGSETWLRLQPVHCTAATHLALPHQLHALRRRRQPHQQVLLRQRMEAAVQRSEQASGWSAQGVSAHKRMPVSMPPEPVNAETPQRHHGYAPHTRTANGARTVPAGTGCHVRS